MPVISDSVLVPTLPSGTTGRGVTERCSRRCASRSEAHQSILFLCFTPYRTIHTLQKELMPVPTEFIDMVEYQTLFSRLVMKEAVANLQKDLTGRGRQRAGGAVTGKVGPRH